MEFKDILSIAGMPGLYSLVSTKNNGIVVKSLEDGKSQFVSSRLQGVSTLDNISVYLVHEETTELKKVLREMMNKESELPLPDPKADQKLLKEYFKKIVPGDDEEKVHASDMKKMIKWYQILKEHNLIPAEEETETNTDESKAEEENAEIKAGGSEKKKEE